MVALTRTVVKDKAQASTYFGGGAMKALGSGKVGGYLIVFGKPADSQGEFFDPDVELHLNWLPSAERPVLYHHGLREQDIIEEIGTLTKLVRDSKGWWAEAQLDMSNPIARDVYARVLCGEIGWSSGSAPHLSKVLDDGCIIEWYLIEASLTPTPAAGRRTSVQALKFNSLSTTSRLTDKTATGSAREPSAKGRTVGKESVSVAAVRKPITEKAMNMATKNTVLIGAMRDAGIDSDAILKVLEAVDTDNAPMIAADEDADTDTELDANPIAADVMDDDAAVMSDTSADDEDETTKGDAVEGDAVTIYDSSPAAPVATSSQQVEPPVSQAKAKPKAAATPKPKTAKTQQFTARDIANEVLRQMRTAPAASKAQSFQGRNPARLNNRVADVQAKYGDLDAMDMAYTSIVLQKMKRANPDLEISPFPAEFYHVLATKAQDEIEDKTLRLGSRDKLLVQRIRTLAVKDSWNNTGTAADGGNWVPDLWSTQLWERVRIDNNVARNVQVFQMPSPTYEYPVESADPTVYSVGQADTDAENTFATNVFTKSKMTVDKMQFSAKKTGLQVPFSTEMNEDSIIPFIPQLRSQAVRAFANSIDFNLLNSDDTTGTSNINYKGGNTSSVPTANFLFGGGDGMRHNALVNNTTALFSFGGGNPTLQGIRKARFKMISSLNAYGVNPEDLVLIVDPFTWGQMLSIDEINSFINNGRDATVNTGRIPNLDSTPVFPSWELKLTDSTGFVTSTNDNVPSASNYGQMVIFAKNAWKVGYVRQVMTDVSYLPYYDSYVLTMTCRYAIGKKDTIASAVGYYLNVA